MAGRALRDLARAPPRRRPGPGILRAFAPSQKVVYPQRLGKVGVIHRLHWLLSKRQGTERRRRRRMHISLMPVDVLPREMGSSRCTWGWV